MLTLSSLGAASAGTAAELLATKLVTLAAGLSAEGKQLCQYVSRFNSCASIVSADSSSLGSKGRAPFPK